MLATTTRRDFLLDEYAAEALPDLVFILDHLGKPPIVTGILDVALHFTAMLCPDERTAILAETATRVYGL